LKPDKILLDPKPVPYIPVPAPELTAAEEEQMLLDIQNGWLLENNWLQIGYTRDKSGFTYAPGEGALRPSAKTAPFIDPDATLLTSTPRKLLVKRASGRHEYDGSSDVADEIVENIDLYGHLQLPSKRKIQDALLYAEEVVIREEKVRDYKATKSHRARVVESENKIREYAIAEQQQANEDFAKSLLRETLSERIKSFLPDGLNTYKLLEYIKKNYQPKVVDSILRDFCALYSYAFVDKISGKLTMLQSVQMFEKLVADLKKVEPLATPDVIMKLTFLNFIEKLVDQTYGNVHSELQVTLTMVKAKEYTTQTLEEYYAAFRNLKCSNQLIVAKNAQIKIPPPPPGKPGMNSQGGSTKPQSNSKTNTGGNFWCNTCSWNSTHPSEFCRNPRASKHYDYPGSGPKSEANKGYKPSARDKAEAAEVKKAYEAKGKDKGSSKKTDRSDGKSSESQPAVKKYKHSLQMNREITTLDKSGNGNISILYDSGASFHVTGNRHILQDISALPTPRITLTGNGLVTCSYVGRVEIRFVKDDDLTEFKTVYLIDSNIGDHLIISQGMIEKYGNMHTISGEGTFGVYENADVFSETPIFTGYRGKDNCSMLNYYEIIKVSEEQLEISRLFVTTRSKTRGAAEIEEVVDGNPIAMDPLILSY